MGEPVLRYEDLVQLRPFNKWRHPAITVRLLSIKVWLWLRGYRSRERSPKEQEEELAVLKKMAGTHRK